VKSVSTRYGTKGFIVAGIGFICLLVGIGLVVSSFLSFANDLSPSNTPFGNISTSLGGNKTVSYSVGTSLRGNEGEVITIYPDRPPEPPFAQFIFGGLLAVGGTFLIKLGLGIAVVENAGSIANWTKNVFSKRTCPELNPHETSSNTKRTCSQCGTVVSETSKFCNQCGHRLQ
jgi:hypothetical protein